MEAYIIATRKPNKTSEILVRILDLSQSATVHKLEAPLSKVIMLIKQGKLHFKNAELIDSKLLSHGEDIRNSLKRLDNLSEEEASHIHFIIEGLNIVSVITNHPHAPLLMTTGCDLKSDVRIQLPGKFHIESRHKTLTKDGKPIYDLDNVSNYKFGEGYAPDPKKPYFQHSMHLSYNTCGKGWAVYGGWFRWKDGTPLISRDIKVEPVLANLASTRYKMSDKPALEAKLDMIYSQSSLEDWGKVEYYREEPFIYYLDKTLGLISYIEDSLQHRLNTTGMYHNFPLDTTKLKLNLYNIFLKQEDTGLKSAFITIANILTRYTQQIKYKDLLKTYEKHPNESDWVTVFEYNELKIKLLNFTNNATIFKTLEDGYIQIYVITYKNKLYYAGKMVNTSKINIGKSRYLSSLNNLNKQVSMKSNQTSLLELLKIGDIADYSIHSGTVGNIPVNHDIALFVYQASTETSIHLGRDERWTTEPESIQNILDMYTGKIYKFRVFDMFLDSKFESRQYTRDSMYDLNKSNATLIDIITPNSFEDIYKVIDNTI